MSLQLPVPIMDVSTVVHRRLRRWWRLGRRRRLRSQATTSRTDCRRNYPMRKHESMRPLRALRYRAAPMRSAAVLVGAGRTIASTCTHLCGFGHRDTHLKIFSCSRVGLLIFSALPKFVSCCAMHAAEDASPSLLQSACSSLLSCLMCELSVCTDYTTERRLAFERDCSRVLLRADEQRVDEAAIKRLVTSAQVWRRWNFTFFLSV